MKNLLRKLIGWLQGKRSVPLTFHREPQAEIPHAISHPVAVDCKVRTVVWTIDEAEAAWMAGRTKYNLGETFRTFAMSLESMAGSFLVDGDAARVVVCVNGAVKKRILSAQLDKIRVLDISRTEQAREEERLERQKWAKSSLDPEPIAGRTCGACGGRLMLIVLNYYCEQWTDVITPADKAEKCLGCGRLTEL